MLIRKMHLIKKIIKHYLGNKENVCTHKRYVPNNDITININVNVAFFILLYKWCHET